MTTLAVHPQPATDETTADLMIHESRTNLDNCQQYAAEMSHTEEGRLYIRMLEETCRHALQWAQAHHHG